jgi:epoxyqueuosine reductase
LITSVALDPDPPTGAHCGSCTSCLTACPTDALGDGLVMDARRCISYLTIEHRGAIPAALRPRLGAWIFGCDACQTVCPWNASERPAVAGGPDPTEPWIRPPLRDPAPDVDALFPRLADLVGLDDAGFRTRYGRTAVARTKRRGLLRNVAVALGNATRPTALPLLGTLLHDREPLVRAHAAWALGAHAARGAAEARRTLNTHRAHDDDSTVRMEIDAALAPPALSS